MRKPKNKSFLTVKSSEDVFGTATFKSLFPEETGRPVLLAVIPTVTEMTDNVKKKSMTLTISTDSTKTTGARKSSLASILSKIQDFIDAAKYVIALLLVFTMCWLPWLIMFAGDIAYHRSGWFETTVEVLWHSIMTMQWHYCHTWSLQNVCYQGQGLVNAPLEERLKVQLCLHGLFQMPDTDDQNTIIKLESTLTNCHFSNDTFNDTQTICAEAFLPIPCILYEQAC